MIKIENKLFKEQLLCSRVKFCAIIVSYNNATDNIISIRNILPEIIHRNS
jgi:hypothetical protein